MKALLVVDVPSDYGDVVDNKAIVTLRNGKLGTSLRVHNVPLKPMPEKLQFQEPFNDDYTVSWASRLGFVDGWNACLEEIEG